MSTAPLLHAGSLIASHAAAAFAALVPTGLFTLWPGRVMHKVFFGG